MTTPKLLHNVKFFQKCIIVNDKGQILALRRDQNDVRRPNCWDLPGGNYEAGETVDECIKREIREETNLIVNSVRPVYIASNMGKTDIDLNVIAVCQVRKHWGGEVVLADEHVEYRWVSSDQFMQLETGDDGGFLKDSVRSYQSLLNTER